MVALVAIFECMPKENMEDLSKAINLECGIWISLFMRQLLFYNRYEFHKSFGIWIG